MLNEQTMEKLNAMKLDGMAEGFREQLAQPAAIDGLGFEERFGLLVDRQVSYREDRRMKSLLKDARLKVNACMEDIDYRTPRGLDKEMLLTLAGCEFIRRSQNVIITGFTGSGKTYLACALGNRACREGMSTFYIRAPKLYYTVALARADGSYGKLIARLARVRLLIIDDFGLAPLDDSSRRDLLEIVEDRYGSSSTVMASQLPVNHWHEQIGDPTIADAILDRLIHNAHRINLKGEKTMRNPGKS